MDHLLLRAGVGAVDDDPDIRYPLSRYLGENELRVTVVATQRELSAVMSHRAGRSS